MACNVIRVQPWFEPMLYIVNSSPLVPHIYASMIWVSISSGNGLSTIGLQPITWIPILICSLQWPHHGRDSVSNNQPHDCLLNHFFRRRSKKTSKLRVTGPCAGNSPGPANSPHRWPVTRKMFPFDDVIMVSTMKTLTVHSRYLAALSQNSETQNSEFFRQHLLI